MAKKRGAPPKPVANSKTELIQLRVGEAEKAAFQRAAELDGKKLSEWIRDRLRRDSRKELEERSEEVPFLR